MNGLMFNANVTSNAIPNYCLYLINARAVTNESIRSTVIKRPPNQMVSHRTVINVLGTTSAELGAPRVLVPNRKRVMIMALLCCHLNSKQTDWQAGFGAISTCEPSLDISRLYLVKTANLTYQKVLDLKMQIIFFAVLYYDTKKLWNVAGNRVATYGTSLKEWGKHTMQPSDSGSGTHSEPLAQDFWQTKAFKSRQKPLANACPKPVDAMNAVGLVLPKCGLLNNFLLFYYLINSYIRSNIQ